MEGLFSLSVKLEQSQLGQQVAGQTFHITRRVHSCAKLAQRSCLSAHLLAGNPSVLGSVALSRTTLMDESVTELLISVLTVETKEVNFMAFTISISKSSSVDV